MSQVFVSTQWLAENLSSPQVIAVDGSWYLPSAGRNARAEFLGRHIPGAVFFDIDRVADTDTGLPHMLPAPEVFAEAVGALGVEANMTIVIYDDVGLFSAPRVWWTFKAMGVEHVHILEGGGARWRAEGRPIESGEASRPPRAFTARPQPGLFVGFDTVRERMRDGATAVVDARSPERFSGLAPEPRPGLRSGHIPGSLNLPVGLLSDAGVMKSVPDLRRIFAGADVDIHRPIITTCGSGITAATLALALKVSGAEDVAIYDGSWAEWGSRPDAEIA